MHEASAAPVSVVADAALPVGQAVGNDGKGLVLHDGLVTVLCAAAREQDDRRTGFAALGEGQRPGEGHARVRTGQRHLLAAVGEGRTGCLRTAHLFHAPDQAQRKRCRPLLKGPVNERVAPQDPGVADAQRRDGKGHERVRPCDGIHGDAPCALVGRVQCTGPASVRLLEMSHETQLHRADVQLALPVACQPLGGQTPDAERQEQEESDVQMFHILFISD